MAVKIGSARIDENGRITGGKAGDQTGGEVSTQNWYNHSKGWRVLRPKNSAIAEKMAQGMQAACDNKHIGYNQNERNTLYAAAKLCGFDPAKVTKDVNTDCSALVRVCCAFAGVSVSDFNTANEANVLLASGAFVEMGDNTDTSAYLKRGDVLVTRTKGHTAIVLSNGSKATVAIDAAVLKAQKALLALGYSLPKYGADGEWGVETSSAVRAFQRDKGIPETGVIGKTTLAALYGGSVVVTGDSVYVRAAPLGTILGVVQRGARLDYQGQDRDGWHLVEYRGQNAWISGKYTAVE